MESSYKELAIKLDEIPNGFPPTKSGVELQLLAKLFAPEEARIASRMSMNYQDAKKIGELNGLEETAIRPLLISMVKRGLIDIKKMEGIGLAFRLIPFVVGFYERQNAKIDKEFAVLFEQYYREAFHRVMTVNPSVHRVIPVEKSIPVNIDVMPYEKASNYLEKAEAWGVLDCICRVQKRLIGQGCNHSVENCLVFSSRKGAFDRVEDIRAISKEEAFGILTQSENEGLVHSTNNAQGDVNYICNCCSCSCGVLRSMIEYNSQDSIAASDFYAVIDQDLCSGCETCLDRCHFDALSMEKGICVVDVSHCYGCGLCISECPERAITLVGKSPEELTAPPLDDSEWMERRASARKQAANQR